MFTPLNTERELGLGNPGPTVTNSQRWRGITFNGSGSFQYTGTKPVYSTINASIFADKQAGGGADYEFFFKKNNVKISESIVVTNPEKLSTVVMIYSFIAEKNDIITTWIENTTDSDGMLINGWQFLIKE